MSRFLKSTLLLLTLSFIVFTACSKYNNPVDSHETDHDHAEAVGLVITSGEQELVRYEEGQVTGGITIAAGTETSLLSLQFIAEDGDLFTPEGDHYSLNWEITNSAIADVKQYASEDKWALHISGKAAGDTDIIIKIFHGDHADFVSQAITISVTE